jgi:hypothetical protein
VRIPETCTDCGVLILLGAKLKLLEAIDLTPLSSYQRGETAEPAMDHQATSAELKKVRDTLVDQLECVPLLKRLHNKETSCNSD